MPENDRPFHASFISQTPIVMAFVMKSLLETFGNCEAEVEIGPKQTKTVTLIVR